MRTNPLVSPPAVPRLPGALCTPLRVLLLTPRWDDAAAWLAALQQAGLAPSAHYADSLAALPAHLNAPPDLILTAYRLPDGDARQVLRCLRARGLDLPVLVLAARAEVDAAAACLEDGATDYLVTDRLQRLGLVVRRMLTEREAMARYRALAELTAEVLYVFAVRPDSTIVPEWISDAFARLTGYPTEEFPSLLGSRQLIHPDDRGRVGRRWQRLLAGEPDVSEFRIVTKSGETRWWRAHARPQCDATGRVVRIYGAIQDITVQKRAEAALDARMRVLAALHELAVAAGGVRDPAALARLAVERASALLGADGGSLFLWDAAAGCLRPLVVFGPWPPRPLRPGEGVSGQAFIRRAPVCVADYSTWEHAPPDIRALGRWSAAAVPLLVGDQAIGALGLYTPVARPLTPDDVQTLTLVAAQIAPALETAQAHAAAEQRRVEAEALADLARQSVSEPDLERVIHLITEYACRLLGADYAAVALCEPDGTLSLHGRQGRRSQAWYLDRLRPEQTLAGRALAAGQPVVETLATAPPDAYPVHRAEGGRTLLSAPLVTRAERAGGEAPPPPLGAITLGWRRDVTLTPEQVRLAEALAGHAAILVASARSRAALTAHARNLRQLAAIAAAVTAETDLTAILEQIVRATTEIAGLERNSILLLDPAGRTLHHAAAIGLPVAYLRAIDGLVIGPAAGTCGTAAYRGEIVITEDALTDPLWAPYRSVAETYGFRAVWSVPLRGLGERVLGTFAAYPPYPGRPTPEQLELLELYARLAAVAVENARAHAALAASEARLRTVYEAMTCGVIVHAADGRILDANSAAEEFLGLTRDQMRGRQPHELWELFDEEGQPLPLERRMVRELQRRRQPLHARLLALRRPDGEYRWFQADAVPLLGPDGQLEQIVVSFVDFTARRKAETALRQREEQLRQAQKMEALGRLAGGIAHDFNNLLTIINGYSELLLANLPPDHPHHAFIAEIASAGERAAAITSQLLAVSRRQVLAPTVLDLNVIVADTQALLRRLIGEDIQLTVTLRHGLAPVRADPGQLQQVLLNLALNARDAMPHGGCLALETTEATLAAPLAHTHGVVPPGTYVLLRVRDSGVGVAPDVLPHLFEPFFTTKERGAGTGLGLATVYGIVAQSGGHIVVDSAPGQGTTVTVYLPPASAAEAAAPPAASAALPPRGTETILLVEDDSQVRTLARTMLAACGYTVLVAASGEEALRLAAAYDGPLHLLLTDVVMPGLSGPELAARLVAERPGLPVLYISGYTDDRLERHGLPNAMTAFLSKPFTAEALARAVRQVLDIGRC